MVRSRCIVLNFSSQHSNVALYHTYEHTDIRTCTYGASTLYGLQDLAGIKYTACFSLYSKLPQLRRSMGPLTIAINCQIPFIVRKEYSHNPMRQCVR